MSRTFQITEARIETKQFTYRWGLDSLDSMTTLHPGELAIVVGESGGGKTTLLLGAAKASLHNQDINVIYHDANESLTNDERFHWGNGLTWQECNRLTFFTGPHPMDVHPKNSLVLLDGSSGPLTAIREGRGAEHISYYRKIAEKCEIGIILAFSITDGPIYLGEGKVSWHIHKDEISSAFRPADLVVSCFRDRTDKTPTIGLQVLKNRNCQSHTIYRHRVSSRLALDSRIC